MSYTERQDGTWRQLATCSTNVDLIQSSQKAIISQGWGAGGGGGTHTAFPGSPKRRRHWKSQAGLTRGEKWPRTL